MKPTLTVKKQRKNGLILKKYLYLQRILELLFRLQ